MMVEASVFREAGKFDEKYASNIFIDTDLCFRVSNGILVPNLVYRSQRSERR